MKPKVKFLQFQNIRNSIISIEQELNEFILYQDRMLASMLSTLSFSTEEIKELQNLLLTEYLKNESLPF